MRACAGRRDVNIYHWSPVTSGSRSFAVWPLLLPYTLVNVAGWMAPPGGDAKSRRTLHRMGAVWVGVTTTAATVVWLLVAAVAVTRKVNGGGAESPPGVVSGLSFGAAATGAALAMIALVLFSTYVARGFERFRPDSWPEAPRDWKWPWGAGVSAQLEDLRFYDSEKDHRGHWRIHAAVAGLTFGIVVAVVYGGGTERAGHFLARALLAVALLQGLGVALLAAVAVPRSSGRSRRLTARMLGAATAVLGVILLGGLTLSALISFTGIGEVPRGAVAIVYDCYGWAVLAGIGTVLLCVVLRLLTPVPAEAGAARALIPTLGARLRARLATVLSDIDRIVFAVAVTFALTAMTALVLRWSALWDGTWRVTATGPVNVARATFAFVLAFAVLNLVKSRASPTALRRIGNVWDILTFWPRTFHPFAVRPYAERAVPELREFLETAPRRGRMVVAAHSQGSVLAYAAIRPYMKGNDADRPAFSLVTFGSPLRSLYAAVFPHYFDPADFAATRSQIGGDWVNCFRFTDHVGRAVFVEEAEAAEAYEPEGERRADRPVADVRPPERKVLGHNDYWGEPVVRDAVKEGEQRTEGAAEA